MAPSSCEPGTVIVTTVSEARDAAPHYEIRVSGLVPKDVLTEIEGVRVVVDRVQTVLRGPVPDQAPLHRIINRLHRTGLDLIEDRHPLDDDCVQDNQEPT